MFHRAGWLLLLALFACEDASTGDEDAAPPPRTRTDSTVVEEPPPAPDARPEVDAAVDAAALADEGPMADAAPEGECAGDGDCGPGRVCHEARCVDGTRCDRDPDCPAGRVCIARICLADPTSTGGLVAEPDRLVFTFGSAGERSVRGTHLRNDGADVVVVERLVFDGAATFSLDQPVELPLRLVPGQGADVLVAYTADDINDDQGVLRAFTDRPAAEPLEIRLGSEHKVVGGRDPCLQVRPARLDFGAVPRGQQGTLAFDLLSCGEVPVQVNAIRRGQSIFGALPATFDIPNPPAYPLVLAPGASHRVEVTYSPRRAGLQAGFWNVLSTDRQTPEQRVDVSALATPPALEDVEFHIRLSWDTDLTDVDLHLLGPGGRMWTCAGDCYFSNPNPNWGDANDFRDDPFLDVDDVDGFGPENINLEAPAPGTYRVLVHYWADHQGNVPSATVEVLNQGNVVGRYGPQRLARVNDVWEVVEIDWPGLALRPLGNVANQQRGALCGGF